MKRICTAVLALILACTFVGCRQPHAADSTQSSVPSTIAPTDTPTLPPETTQPEPSLPAGHSLTVDGDLITGGSVISDGIAYAPAEEFIRAVDGLELTQEEDGTLGFQWNLLDVVLSPGQLGPVINGRPHPLKQEILTHQGQIYVPLEEFCQILGLSILNDEAQSHIYCTSGISELHVPQGVSVPVLMYHAVSDDLWGFEELFVSPSDMEQQLAYLTENGYDPIFFEDLPNLENYDKPVILTFDDGYLDNYTQLYPLLEKYNAKATIFVITSAMGVSQRSMTREQVKELSDSGLVSIQSHTVNHPELSSLDEVQQLTEIRDSKLEVARMTGREPHVLCYPSGERNETTKELTAQYYNFGIDMNGGLYTTGDDPMTVSRYYVSRYTTLDEFAAMVSAD